jgi:hypothetical protein
LVWPYGGGDITTEIVPVQQPEVDSELKVSPKGEQTATLAAVSPMAHPAVAEMNHVKPPQVRVTVVGTSWPHRFLAPDHDIVPVHVKVTLWPLRQVQVPVPLTKLATSVVATGTPGQQSTSVPGA